jgi:hypothetical protein
MRSYGLSHVVSWRTQRNRPQAIRQDRRSQNVHPGGRSIWLTNSRSCRTASLLRSCFAVNFDPPCAPSLGFHLGIDTSSSFIECSASRRGRGDHSVYLEGRESTKLLPGCGFNKKAGEYSEEDTHRPAHHYREVVARRTSGASAGQSANISLEKETRETREGFTTGQHHRNTPLKLCTAPFDAAQPKSVPSSSRLEATSTLTRSLTSHRQHRVESAEGEGIGKRPFYGSTSRLVGYHIQVAGRVGRSKVSGRRNATLVQRHQSRHGFESPRRAQRMTMHRLRRADQQPIRMLGEHSADRIHFGGVV